MTTTALLIRRPAPLGFATALTVAAAAAGYAVASRRYRRLLHTDGLTGAASRAGLMADLRRRSRGRREYLVALLDLDRFKQVNDTLGHDAGDRVLVGVVQRLRAVVDDLGGLVGRLGGDELVVICPSPSAAASSDLGAHLMLAVAEPVTADLWVSASIGLVHAIPGDDPRRLLATADHLQYEAKAAGGCCVVEHDLEQELGEVLERPGIRPRDLLDGHRELVAARWAD